MTDWDLCSIVEAFDSTPGFELFENIGEVNDEYFMTGDYKNEDGPFIRDFQNEDGPFIRDFQNEDGPFNRDFQMIPLPSDAVTYDTLCSASFYNEFGLFDTLFHPDPLQDDKETHLTSDVDLDGDFGLFSDILKSSYLGNVQTERPDTFFGVSLPDIDNDLLRTMTTDSVSGYVEPEETTENASNNAIASYIAEHDHCYSINIKQTEPEKFTSPSASSESLSEISSSEEELDILTVPAQPRDQIQLAVPSHEAPTRQSRSKKKREKFRRIMSEITVPKVPVQKIKARGAKSKKLKASPGSSPNYSGDDSVKRKEHNYSERQRRRDQQNLLQNLRNCIPELQAVLKAPKVRILDGARKLISFLKLEETRLTKNKSSLEETQRRLIKKLRTLKVSEINALKQLKYSKILLKQKLKY